MSFKQLSILLSVLLIFTACNKTETKESAPKQLQEVSIKILKKETLPIWVDFTGKSEASETMTVLARVEGTLKKMNFKAGQRVKKGDILFEIEDIKYKANYDKALGELKSNQANLELAKINVKRYKPLVDKELSPKEKLDDLMTQEKQAEASVLVSQAGVEQAKLDYDHTKVRAEINGLISENLIDVGNVVGQSSNNVELATIVNQNPLYVYIHPSTQDLAKIQKYASKDPIPVHASIGKLSLDKTNYFEGYVDYIDPNTDPSTGTVNVRIRIDNPEGQLRGGMHMNVSLFVTDEIPLISINSALIRQDQGGKFVYTLKDSIVVQTYIQEALQVKNLSIIKKDGGLVEGSALIISGTQKLHAGTKVKVKVEGK